MNIKAELKDFYNTESDKYTSTRKKQRSEAVLLVNEFNKIDKKTIKVLELGCGGGRLLEHMGQVKKNIIYTGVDLSDNLINISKKIIKNETKIKASFICDDMTNYISKTKQEEFDFIVCIASFQHIPSIKERIFLLKSFYRSLKYEGKVIMINRSFSKWFIIKYFKNILNSFFYNLIRFGRLSFNDMLIPRKSKGKTYKRYYHIFSLKELKNIFKLSGFTIEMLCYLGKDGKKSDQIKNAKNTIMIAIKNI